VEFFFYVVSNGHISGSSVMTFEWPANDDPECVIAPPPAPEAPRRTSPRAAAMQCPRMCVACRRRLRVGHRRPKRADWASPQRLEELLGK
jgi:hypothetical protein